MTTLHTDAELITGGRAIITNMCKGDRWRMSIPVHRDDSDILLSELLDRFEALVAEQQSAVHVAFTHHERGPWHILGRNEILDDVTYMPAPEAGGG